VTVRAITWHEGRWVEGNPPIFGPFTHSLWMASAVFDGARAFRRLAPDLDRHCARVVESARAFGMKPKVTGEEIYELAWDGIERFPPEAELYIRPLFYFEDGFVAPDLDSSRFILSLEVRPLVPLRGASACVSSYRRPTPEMAPTSAKASCLYPNVARAMMEARGKGFDSAIMLDAAGNVAEFTTSNLFIAKDGVVSTPVPNGCFLAGITRRRVMELLRAAGVEVRECTLCLADVFAADEVFWTGNYSKVMPVVRVEDRNYHQGRFAEVARRLYFEFAEREGGRRPRRQAAAASL
jgi:branched-chain amino acid aminotransferase